MKKLASLAVLVSACAFAAPQFVTPAMMKRNGLTDEQYEMLWNQGKHPQIDIATARDWIFRSSRYANVVEWLEICGKTNDFAKLSHKLQGDNFELAETNKEVVEENAVLVRKNKTLATDLENADGYRQAVKAIEKAVNKPTTMIPHVDNYMPQIQTQNIDLLYPPIVF